MKYFTLIVLLALIITIQSSGQETYIYSKDEKIELEALDEWVMVDLNNNSDIFEYLINSKQNKQIEHNGRSIYKLT